MRLSNLKGDIFGGLTAGIVALPLALAFGVQSGLGASAGLYGAIVLGLIASILGGTKTQISGPTGPMTILSATVVALAISKYGDIEHAWGIIILTFLLAGAFQIIFGILKIGKYVKYIPYPVLSGFMSGIGVIIIIFQVFPLLGLTSPVRIMDVVKELPQALSITNNTSVLLALGTVLIIYLFPRITKVVPSTLVALLIITLVSVLFSLETPAIGTMPTGLPSIKISALGGINLSDLSLILIPAITLAGLGTIDTLLTSVVADNITRTKHKSNQELIGQGIGNMLASLFGGIPGAGATMRTVVNIKSGGHSKLSGVIHALLLLLIVLGLAKYVAFIPLAALAGILITVGISIIDLKGLKSIFLIPKSDALVLITVLFLTVFVDLLQAVGIGMVIASVIFMRKASDMVEHNTSLDKVDKYDREIAWEDESNLDLNKWKNVYIKRFDGPIFFGVAAKILDRINKIPTDAKVIIFRMKQVPFIDQTGLHALEEVIKEMQKMGIVVVFTMTQAQPLYLLKRNRFVPNIIPEKYLFKSIDACAEWLKEYDQESKNDS
ncbi:MAG: SulP family inorganic anion transporter [Bacteroidetes bacterium]|nr:SulP family inorganic anion transporter [Bacteroidota bacterium]MBT5530744.1 SulP family inorganic anion transporter [Cytophagia bacterium]MBT3424280.1 SulP family inorganic anion transporter [Bacteroidota bacterium]MBT3802815.1 SulP family inorganic anion transporter [Bacteroidota bacterium]MBT3935866.1 SulP family inorganic anion transporter [Bacteroidota bacterium]